MRQPVEISLDGMFKGKVQTLESAAAWYLHLKVYEHKIYCICFFQRERKRNHALGFLRTGDKFSFSSLYEETSL